VKVSTHTVRLVMEEHGYRPPKVKRSKHEERYEAVRPNHLWHADFAQRYINRTSTFSLIFIDDCSRFVVGHGVDDAERADMVINAFGQAVERHGRPESVMTDKGSAFWSWKGISRFTALMTEMGVEHIQAEHKETNGKIGNFNGNVQKESFDKYEFYSLEEMKRRLSGHLRWYNFSRKDEDLPGCWVVRCEHAEVQHSAGGASGALRVIHRPAGYGPSAARWRRPASVRARRDSDPPRRPGAKIVVDGDAWMERRVQGASRTVCWRHGYRQQRCRAATTPRPSSEDIAGRDAELEVR